MYKLGDRCIGDNFATVAMVTTFAEYLGKGLPKLKVVAYLAGEDETKLEGADIIVSTTKKASTGIDLPGLTRVFQTIMVSSKAENYQTLGRLRKIDDPNVDTAFIYGICSQIPKHQEYHLKRQKDLLPLIYKADNIKIREPI